MTNGYYVEYNTPNGLVIFVTNENMIRIYNEEKNITIMVHKDDESIEIIAGKHIG